MVRVAVIDVGSNSVRLLIAGVSADGAVKPLKTGLITTRLGEGIGFGKLLPGAMGRTVEAIGEFSKIINEWLVEKVLVTATSAVRDAENKREFMGMVEGATGYRVRVLAGPEEAFLSYYGVVRGFSHFPGGAVVIDVGGGSTEFTWQRNDRLLCCSTRVGAVRMTEGGHDDAAIRQILCPVHEKVKESGYSALVGVGGTITTLAAMELKLETYDPARVHGYKLELDRVEYLLDTLQRVGPGGRKKLPGLQAARADIIVAGVRIVLVVMRELRINVLHVSEADILYGLASDGVCPVEKKNVICYQ